MNVYIAALQEHIVKKFSGNVLIKMKWLDAYDHGGWVFDWYCDMTGAQRYAKLEFVRQCEMVKGVSVMNLQVIGSK